MRILNFILLFLTMSSFQVNATQTNINQDNVKNNKEVIVYKFSQQYWETKPGETLGEITAILLPADTNRQEQLIQDIVVNNPHGFINNNPDQMLAGIRLWLPNTTNPNLNKTPKNEDEIEVEYFSWGSIKKYKKK